MELQFNKSVCSCLKGVIREIRSAEQAQEIRIPDGMPDVGRILSAWGQMILRGKEWRSDSIGLSAGMMVWVLYQPEDGSMPRCLEGWIPFQLSWDLPEQTPEGNIRMLCLPRFVDARTVSARKIMVRAGTSALAEACVPASAAVFSPDSLPEDVEILKNSYPVRLPREAGEKTFQLDEELSFPPSIPQPRKLICYRLDPAVTDKKVLGGKMVFRGNTNLHVLYESEEGQLHSWDFDLPFSQYQDLTSTHSTDARTDILMAPTLLELDLEDEGHLRLKCGMVAQYLVDDLQMLELVEDAYSPVRELGVRQEQLELPVLLDSRRENIYAEQNLPADANLVADSSIMPDFPRIRKTEDGVCLDLSGQCQILYYDADGQLQSASQRWEAQHDLKAAQESRIFAQPESMPLPQAVPGAGSVNMRTEIPLQISAWEDGGLPMVTGLELGEIQEPDSMRPSLILRRAGDRRLWDLARESGSTVAAIRRANNLADDPAADQMLLIPIF